MFHNKRVDNRASMPPATFDGVVTGIYSDAQSRMLVEIAIVVNGVEKLVKKQKLQLGFNAFIGQKVNVEFVPNKSGVFVIVKEKR